MFLPPGKAKVPRKARWAKVNKSVTKTSDGAKAKMNNITNTLSKQFEQLKRKQSVQNMTTRLSGMKESFTSGVDTSKSNLSATISTAYAYMPTIEASLLWSFVCCVVVFLPLVFVIYMVTKLDSNCNIAWILSWSKIHPCWVDLGPHGHNWQFAMSGWETQTLNQTQLELVAYSHCGLYGTMPLDC